MTERRRFSLSERATLLAAAGGRCQECGGDLRKGWHADHRTPFSHGGRTDVLNGQALCAACNLRKGDRMAWVAPWPEGEGLRSWQQQCLLRVLARTGDERDFLVVAQPGAGKTKLALRVAHSKLADGIVDRLVVVCPTEHLKRQWSKQAFDVGIHLNPSWGNGDGLELGEFHGICVTYQQVAAAPGAQRALCGMRRTLAIFDEVHHAGQVLAWGQTLAEAFSGATFRLPMSGTPFRSDGHPIPFVSYTRDEEGVLRSQADYGYSYGAALADGVCRAILFPSFNGTVEWEWKGNIHRHTLTEDLPDQMDRQRLRMALDAGPGGDWLPVVLKQADAELSRCRASGHVDAAGLVIAREQRHAEKIAGLLATITGSQPTIAISDDPRASDHIQAFSTGTGRWIVAVKMVSEGVDIPRLRVGVFATNVITELFFRQVVGRFVRIVPGLEDQPAYLYIPAVDALKRHAEAIKEERDHSLLEQEKTLDAELEDMADEEGETGRLPVSAVPDLIGTGGGVLDELITLAGRIKAEELEGVRPLGEAVGFSTLSEFAKLVAFCRLRDTAGVAQGAPAASHQKAGDTLSEERKKIQKLISAKVSRFSIQTGESHADIHTRLNRRDGVRNIKECSTDQLRARITTLNEWLGGVDA